VPFRGRRHYPRQTEQHDSWLAEPLFDELGYGGRESALDFSERAELAFEEGEEANHRSDEYVMSAVILATVLFFAGISTIFKVHAMQYVLLGLATALFAVCAWDIGTLPKLF
jgi:hypothetical protein